ncbi:ribosome maturation factor RimM [Pseudochryseolinea flava]|uniref:Ribosome maturation factor RimM n=1 Tax=Pseudochryseolinea flava TaxID=2059302 RepID=A0A364Y6X8_9BACT|nr:ribosome maturation factor RimM [Pseudochryseolinea flava]RAW02811.1 16S rRNA processing protein RimM [Pseudochryseolinea flava]
MDINSSYKVGYVLKPHGLKGEVTISLEDDAPDFSAIESVFLEKDNRLVPYFIESISIRDAKAFVKFEEVDTMDAAQAISKRALYLPKSSRPKSGRGEFYDDEILGFDVDDDAAGNLGKVTTVVDAGANKLLVVVDANAKEVLIPVNGPFITSINKTKKKIAVSLPDGFLDI